MCNCPRDRLCDLCYQGAWDNLRGVAATRGEVWADDAARRVRTRQPWPAFSGRTAELARRKVEDMTRNPRLLEDLAIELASWAARRWAASVADAAS